MKGPKFISVPIINPAIIINSTKENVFHLAQERKDNTYIKLPMRPKYNTNLGQPGKYSISPISFIPLPKIKDNVELSIALYI